ncbi:MAG TPA: phosphonate metabolism protein/1,5-bisphosphokinase (PRPP-forming) PhnN [Acetobacteraceae bacterium]
MVGPSGVGKDTLLNAARDALSADPRFRFVRRTITRPADAGGEAHEAVTDAQFEARAFALSWRAHGLRYGIPADITEDIKAGRVVVANVSRNAVADAAGRFPVRVIEVHAPPAVLAARLAGRGREDAKDMAARLAREVRLPGSVAVERVCNDGPRQQGAAQFIDALSRAASAVRQAETAPPRSPG